MCIVLGGATLALAAAGAVTLSLRIAIVLALMTFAALDLILLSTERLPGWLVGATIVGLALASGTHAAARPMVYGRFVAPLLLFIAVVRVGAWSDPDRRTKKVTVGAMIAFGLILLSATTSVGITETVEKGMASLIIILGICAALRWALSRGTMLQHAVLAAYSVLVLSNLAMVVVGGDVYSSVNRFRGWTINSNTLGALCAFAVPVAASAMITQRGIRRLASATVLAGAGVLLVLTGSRASLLGALLALATVLRVTQVARSLLFVGCSLALLVLAPLAFRSANDADLLRSVERQGASGREQVWPIAIREIREKPLTGAGFSTTEQRFLEGEFGEFSIFQGGYFHNSYLEAGVELGVAGFLVVVGAGAYALSHMVRPVRIEHGWAAGVAVTGAVIGFFETGLLVPGSVLMFSFWLAVGVLLVHAGPPRRVPGSDGGATLAPVESRPSYPVTLS